ncbi:pseudouridine synthase family protein isoform X2 [Wolffia australiana]
MEPHSQYQESIPTVQCIIEKALIRITKLDRKVLCLVGASRTDAGVHAWGQVAHFETTSNYEDLEDFHTAINGLLPPDIRVREFCPAGPQFHARFSTESKIYHYKIYNGPVMDPFQTRYAYHCAYKLDPSLMREAAQYYVGKHDFTSFANTSRNDRVINPEKEIFRFDVVEVGPILQLEVEGSGFLFRQVRNMVALLLQVGKEALPPDVVPTILAARDRRVLAKYALLAPPHGLCLISVKYREDALKEQPVTSSFGRIRTMRKCKLPFY